MITPSYGLTATERVLPRLALDWTTGLSQPGVNVVRAGVATFVGSDGLIQSATANTQRIDWSTNTPGLLIEELRKNFLLWSEALNNAVWILDNSGGTNPVVTANQAISPDGTLTADRIQLNRGTGSFSRIQQGSTTVSSVHTFSVWMKLYSGTTPANVGIRIDSTGVNCVVTDAWQRFSVTSATANTAPNGQILLFSTLGSDATADIVVWGAQLEAGAFSTSYIPTSNIAVTRNADVATMTGTNFSSWFNASEGAFVASFDTYSPTTQKYIGAVSAGGTIANSFLFTILSGSTDNYVLSGGVQQARLLTGTIAANTLAKLGFRYANADFAIAANGGGLQTQLSGSLPVGMDRLNIGSSAGNGVQLNGHMAKLFWYSKLTNAELVAFTK